MSDCELVFVDSHGDPPPVGSFAEKLLRACSVDDETIWDQLGMREMNESELVDAVAQLRALGWDFLYVVRQ